MNGLGAALYLFAKHPDHWQRVRQDPELVPGAFAKVLLMYGSANRDRCQNASMLIVAGHLRVDPAVRQTYLDGCRSVVEAARRTEGCQDFHLSADPLEPDRINIFEAWDSAAAVESFRGSGPDDGQGQMIRSAEVQQFTIASSVRLTE